MLKGKIYSQTAIALIQEAKLDSGGEDRSESKESRSDPGDDPGDYCQRFLIAVMSDKEVYV